MMAGVQLGMLRFDLGRMAEFEPLLDSMSRDHPAMSSWRYFRLGAYFETGRVDEVQRELDELKHTGIGALPFDMLWAASAACIVEAVAVLTDRGLAESLYDALRPYGDRCVVVGPAIASLGSAKLTTPEPVASPV